MLKPFGQDIWTADGPDVTASLGFHYPTRIAVIRLTGGGLFVWSPTALSDDLRASVNAVGDVRYLVASNSLHHMFLADWKRASPTAEIHGAPGLVHLRKDISLDGELRDEPAPGWASDIEQVVVRGNRITTDVVFFHRASRAVIFTDLLQQLPPGWFKGWRALVARLDLMTSPEPAVPRKFRAAFSDLRAARTAIDRILEWPAMSVLMAHGPPVTKDAKAFLARAFQCLIK